MTPRMQELIKELHYCKTFFDRVLYRKALKELSEYITTLGNQLTLTDEERANWSKIAEQGITKHEHLSPHWEQVIEFYKAYEHRVMIGQGLVKTEHGYISK